MGISLQLFRCSATIVVAVSFICPVTNGQEFDLVEPKTPGLARFIQGVLDCKHCPGLSLAIVKDGEVVLKTGYGKRNLLSGELVDAQTLFPIGSLTKVFTAMTLADIIQGKYHINWDTPLRRFLDDCFRLPDEFRTNEVNLRDLLAHKMGLAESFLLLVMNTNISRAEFTSRLRHLEVEYPFRTKFKYSNSMYTFAGHVAELLTGKQYETLVKERIYEAVGMESSKFAADVLDSAEKMTNFATSYLWNSTTNSHIPLDVKLFEIVRLHAPAGGLVSNAIDMAKWMIYFFNITKSQEAFKEMLSPQFALRGYSKQTRTDYPVDDIETDYGMGIKHGMYRGYHRLSHSGWFAGFNSMLWLFPSKSIGIFGAVNGPYTSDADSALKRINAYVSDLVLGEEPWLNESTACSYPSPWKPSTRKSVGGTEKPIPSEKSLKEYEGEYRHPAFGQFTVYLNNSDGNLHFAYGSLGKGLFTPTKEADVFGMEIYSAIWYLAAGVELKFRRTAAGSVNEIEFPTDNSPGEPATPVFIFTRGLSIPGELCTKFC
ncbi:uncharacterized protein LOC144434413 [Glandiceps talaboti]